MVKTSTIKYGSQTLEITGWYEKAEEGFMESLTITSIICKGVDVCDLLSDFNIDFQELERMAIENF
jgi:hypothetical protein